ncbi:MAG TPA: hypothetical protein VNQ78_00175 [Paracoccus sp. (in: a-proteobacteria)]|uniref:hypothetical protein n=1 Tax=Paracoccus sp. TaxID=267 RepID=UPI002BE030A7|nr:hypothetical protein [Paracoccus sp. (in: a-proteobacteria)]HWL55070.1 hypothetical protein [Paracoccus sp. (in: a-proteobacteria)]
MLTACFPRGQPETARDKPQLVLVPMMTGDEVVMRAPSLRLEKFGYPKDLPGVQYTCDFSQRSTLTCPAAAA